jgi:dTDP-4-dehydrorhamnose reductase
MTALVIGGSGTLGWYLKESLTKAGIAYLAPSSSELDIASDSSVSNFFLANKSFDTIYLLAAETNVDLCETNPESGYQINVLGTERIAKQAVQSGSYLVYISTSGVFGGGSQNKWRYCELDAPSPANLYGTSKLFGEQSIIRICKNYFIVRSSWMIGGGPSRDKKFLSKIIPMLRENKDLTVVHDKIGSLTYAKDLADFLVEAYYKKYTNITHFASENYASRYDIVKYVGALLKSTSKIKGIDSTQFPLPAPRPMSEALYSITNLTKNKKWEEIIEDYMQEWR